MLRRSFRFSCATVQLPDKLRFSFLKPPSPVDEGGFSSFLLPQESDVHISERLPGFQKDQIQLSLENGYLTITATKEVEKDKTKKGKTIRQERYDGTLQRSFYVGDALTEEDITAKLEHGVLSLNIPKKAEKKLPEKKLIAIEG